MNKKWFSFFTALAVLLVSAFSRQQPALAHAELEGAAPAPGSTITQSPSQLRLIFSEGIESMGSRVSLLDANNNAIALDEAQLDPADADNRTLIVGVPAPLAAGTYTVQWKNLSVDGHSETGTYAFTLNLAAPTAAPTVAPTKAAVPTATAAPTIAVAPTLAPTATPGTRDVTLKFALKAGSADVACNKPITNLGTSRSTAQIADARLYLSNIKLLTPAGKAVPLQLATDNVWQSADVALLDFENATGLCKATGTAATRTVVVGRVPAGAYSGIVFDVGVPAALNHADWATAKAPLNVAALWSSPSQGYRFARFDLAVSVSSSARPRAIPVQWGNTGCGAAPTKPCTSANVAQVRLTGFDPGRDTIVADLAALLASVNVTPATGLSCASNPPAANCARLFTNLGLSPATGQCLNGCAGAKFFRIESLQP